MPRESTATSTTADEAGTEVYAVRGGRVAESRWENPNDPYQGYGYEIKVRNSTGVDTYGHMDPSTTPPVGTDLRTSDFVGRYANPTNGNSTNPHVHVGRLDLFGSVVNPGTQSPLSNGRVTTPFMRVDQYHAPPGHKGIDWERIR